MSEATQTDDLLEVIAKILLRCWIFGFILLLLWWGAVTLTGDLVFGVHGDRFGLTRSQLSAIHYCGMGLLQRRTSTIHQTAVWMPAPFKVEDGHR
jgi:hypothetical protein